MFGLTVAQELISQLLLQLQLASQDVNNVIERATADLIDALPRYSTFVIQSGGAVHDSRRV